MSKYKQAHEAVGLNTDALVKLHKRLMESPGYYKHVVSASERLKTKQLAQVVAGLSAEKAGKSVGHVLSRAVLPSAFVLEGDEQAQQFIQTITRVGWLRYWRHYGYNVYRLSPALVGRLLLTELPEASPTGFPFPFPAFRIEVPAGFFGILSLDDEVCDARYIDFLCAPWQRWDSPVSLKKAVGAMIEPAGVADLGMDEDIWKWALFAGSPDPRCPGMLFSHHLNYKMEVCKDFVGVDGHNYLESEMETASIMAAKILVLNLAYALSSNVITPKAEKGGSSKPRDVTRPKVFTFKTSRLDLGVLESAKAMCQGKRAKAGWKIKTKFIVRGHWRNQAHGPGRSERKRIWIEPFWKGPEGEEGWARVSSRN